MARTVSRPAARPAPVPFWIRRLPWLAGLAIAALAAGLYGFTLPFPFVFDDAVYLLKNPLMQDAGSFGYWKHFSAFVNDPKIRALDPDLAVNFVLRPVTYATFFGNFILDGLNPRWFRLVNIVIHAANALLIFHVLWFILRTSPKAAKLTPVSISLIPAVSAVVFLVHPLQTESVTFIVQRFTSLATCFYLLTLLGHLRARTAASQAARWWRLGSVAALIVGMFSKENVFTAPFMLVVIDWLVMGDRLKAACRRALPQLLCLPIIPVMLLTIAHVQNNGVENAGEVLNIVNYNQDSPLHYSLTQLSVILTYLRLILLPAGLNLDPDYPVSTSVFEGRVLISLTIIAGLATSTWLWYRRRQSDVRAALICAGVIWFFVGLAIESSVVPLPDLMAEHRSYLSTIGVLTAVVCGLDLLRTRPAGRGDADRWIAAGVSLWIAALATATVSRNTVWRSDISIWENATAGSPNKARPWFNLAGALYSHQRLAESAECTRKVILLQPRWTDAYLNLATLENHLGHHREALAAAQAGIKLAPDRCELHYGAALAYAKLGNFARGEEAARRVMAIQPSYRKAYLLLGDIYASTQQFEKALQQYQRAATLEPLEPPVAQTVLQIRALLAQRRGGP